MSSKEQAKKGFKTFILTLVISLVIFSGIYYLINAETNENNYDGSSKTTESIEVLGSESVKESPMEEKKDGESVFAELAGTKMEDRAAVLAGSDSVDTTSTIDTTVAVTETVDTTTTVTTTTVVAESTVPDTGVSGPTMGVVLTLVILGFAAYIMFLGPRNVALHNFEKDVIDGLE